MLKLFSDRTVSSIGLFDGISDSNTFISKFLISWDKFPCNEVSIFSETSAVFEIDGCSLDNGISVLTFNLATTWLIVGRLSGLLFQQSINKTNLQLIKTMLFVSFNQVNNNYQYKFLYNLQVYQKWAFL